MKTTEQLEKLDTDGRKLRNETWYQNHRMHVRVVTEYYTQGMAATCFGPLVWPSSGRCITEDRFISKYYGSIWTNDRKMYDVCRVYDKLSHISVHFSVLISYLIAQCTVMGHLKYSDEYYRNGEWKRGLESFGTGEISMAVSCEHCDSATYCQVLSIAYCYWHSWRHGCQ